MKRLDAEALRGFDETRILQRPFFRRFNLPAMTDTEILSSYVIGDSASGMESKLKKLHAVQDAVITYRRLILAQKKRLRRLFDKLYSREETKTESERVAKLLRKYSWREEALELFALKFGKIFSDSEKAIQVKFREEFAANLKQAREAQKISQRALAKKLGISPQSLSQLESGMNEPTLKTLRRAADSLGTTTDALLGRIKTP